MTNVAVIYYSSTGSVYKLASAAAESAKKAGAEVRLRRAAELVAQEVINTNPDWAEHHRATEHVTVAAVEDLDWADVIMFGSPTRFGLPAAQLKQFIDCAGGLWFEGKLLNKVVTSFTSSSQAHGGQESTILAMNNTFYHWGAIIVPPGWADPIQYSPINGNPYGASSVSGRTAGNVPDENLAAAEFQARRAVEIADALARGRASL